MHQQTFKDVEIKYLAMLQSVLDILCQHVVMEHYRAVKDGTKT